MCNTTSVDILRPSPANDKDVPRAGLEVSGAGNVAACHELRGLVRASGRHIARDDGLGGRVEEAHSVSNVDIAIGGTRKLHLGGRWAESAIMHMQTQRYIGAQRTLKAVTVHAIVLFTFILLHFLASHW